jgi:hypothetical protein
MWNNGHMNKTPPKPAAHYTPPHDLTVNTAIRALLQPPKTAKSALFLKDYLRANLQRVKRHRNNPVVTRTTFAELVLAVTLERLKDPIKAQKATVRILRWVYPNQEKDESDRFYPVTYAELNAGRVQTLIALGGVLIPVQSNLEAIAHRRPEQLSMDNSEDNAWIDELTLRVARVL